MTTSRKAEWILGSASPRRREILAGFGLRFRVDPSHVPEPPRNPGESAVCYARRAARLKARAVAARHRSGIVIGADTVVVCGSEVFGKPENRVEAQRMLRRLSGRWHEVITGLALFDCRSRTMRSDYSVSRVHFRRLSAGEIRWYLDTDEHTDKAGAYAIQGYAALFIDRIEGCYFNVVGFPVATFGRLCRRLGRDFMAEVNPKAFRADP